MVKKLAARRLLRSSLSVVDVIISGLGGIFNDGLTTFTLNFALCLPFNWNADISDLLFHHRGILVFKYDQDLQQPLVEEGQRVFPNIRRDAVVRFRDAAADRSNRIAVATDGDRIPDCILKAG